MWILSSRTSSLLPHRFLLHYTNCAIRPNRVLTTRFLSHFIVFLKLSIFSSCTCYIAKNNQLQKLPIIDTLLCPICNNSFYMSLFSKIFYRPAKSVIIFYAELFFLNPFIRINIQRCVTPFFIYTKAITIAHSISIAH